MRAVPAQRHGRVEVLEVTERREPVAEPGRTVLRVVSSGVNFSDILALSVVAREAPAALDLTHDGTIAPLVGGSFPLERAGEALLRLGSYGAVGKLLLKP